MTEEKKTENKVDPENPEVKMDFEILHYSVDQDGHWDRKLLANWGAKEIVNTQTWIIVQERINEARQKVLNGEMSPIGYFMVKCIMDAKLCAQFTGFSSFRVKKHLKPKNFKKLDRTVLQRYADVFEISVDTLVNLEDELKKETK
jgi:hypothetical protein